MNLSVDLRGKTALVTGGSSGIGREVALALAQNGAFVAVNYFQTPAGAQEIVSLIEKKGGKALAVQADVSVQADVQRMMGEVNRAFEGKLDILVNNAGDLIERRVLAEMSESLWDRVVDVNLKSAFLVSQAVLPALKRQPSGRIVNISSIAAQDGGGLGAGAYAAGKAGMIGLTKALAKEFAPLGITVNAIAPGLIATRYHERYNTPENRKNAVQKIPLAREGTAEDVAGSVLFLVSDAAGYITGHTISVNGGMFFA